MSSHLRRALLALPLCLAAPIASAANVTSAYTDLDLDACAAIGADDEQGGFEARCEGYGGIDVFVSEGDIRMDVDFGADDDTFTTFSPFNNLGQKIEWRLRDGAPVATILRHKLANPEGGAGVEILRVTKLNGKGVSGCIAGQVMATGNGTANVDARVIADSVSAFTCGTDVPVLVGDWGALQQDAESQR